MTQVLTIWLIIGGVIAFAGLVLLAALLKITPRKFKGETVWQRFRRSMTTKHSARPSRAPWLDE